MKKDKEWFEEEIKVDLGNLNWKGKLTDIDASNLRGRVNHLIDQLEEPKNECEKIRNLTQANKVMEQKIKELEDELESETNFYTFDDAKKWLEENGYVVTKKAVVPQFVADFYENHKSDWAKTLTVVNYNMCEYDGIGELNEFENWYVNTEKALLILSDMRNGYEVEKEKKYYVLDYEDIPLLERANNQTCKTTTALSIYEDGRDNSRFALTEKEIEDYDDRFWQFAVPVEEVGE